MKQICVALLFTIATAAGAQATAATQTTVSKSGRVQLLCHRTANEDLPENTLESLEQAALLGCDVIELDVRRTLDGELVLNHDGILERLTDGVGEVEKSYQGDLELRDAGVWMGERFAGMRIATFEDAVRLARKQNIRLIVHMKTNGMGADVLEQLRREDMLKHSQFIGEWSEVKKLYPAATEPGFATAWVQAGVTAEQVKAYHRDGKAVVANFSANEHEMDLTAMKAAVAAGVDGINVDYPRIGADAVGRPVEQRLNELAAQASSGDSVARSAAILKLSRYSGFPLQGEFVHWLQDPDDHVSRAAALALATARPRTPTTAFTDALRSEYADSRANAAWALGVLGAPSSMLLPLLHDKDPRVLQETLLAMGRMPGSVSAKQLLPLLAHPEPAVRGAAALALAHNQPTLALQAVPAQLRLEVQQSGKLSADYQRRGKPELTPAEVDVITGYFRCEMKMVQAIAMLKGPGATQALEELALRPNVQFTGMNGIIGSFQLWDRIHAAASPVVQALAADDIDVANHAEWTLIKAGPDVLPNVRKALVSENAKIRQRAIQIVAWQGDRESLETLRTIQTSSAADATLAAWAIQKIESLHPKL